MVHLELTGGAHDGMVLTLPASAKPNRTLEELLWKHQPNDWCYTFTNCSLAEQRRWHRADFIVRIRRAFGQRRPVWYKGVRYQGAGALVPLAGALERSRCMLLIERDEPDGLTIASGWPLEEDVV